VLAQVDVADLDLAGEALLQLLFELSRLLGDALAVAATPGGR